ncbi:MAG: uracil-DNA glycosylase [Bryobacteraceae bacterium]
MHPIEKLQKRITACTVCARLREHCLGVAETKRRAYRDWTYWGKPVPSFGDPEARLLIVGLAPGAHGANRTGRMFTGDSSGDFLYKVLHSTGFANQPHSVSATDGLTLLDAYITASCRCAPPDNKPSREELSNCRPFLVEELKLLRQVRVVVVLGRIAFQTYCSVRNLRGLDFGHAREHRPSGGPVLLCSYHPSQQNTSTGRLTEPMLRAVFVRAKNLIEDPSAPS